MMLLLGPTSVFMRMSKHTSTFKGFNYLNSWWRALFACSRGGERGGGLDECGGHLWRYRGGGARPAPAIRHVAHQPHAAVHLDVDVAFGCHVKDFETIVIQTGELALIGPLPVVPTDGDSCLGVEDCQLPAWHGGGSVEILKTDTKQRTLTKVVKTE